VRTINATDVRPGDRIRISATETATVTRKSSVRKARRGEKYDVVTVHTDAGDISTTLPCTVRVL
jgi:hypothetical protein